MSPNMSTSGAIGGSAIGAIFALSGDGNLEHTALQLVASAGVCGLVMWILLKAQMQRAERDETRHDEAEKALLRMTSQQIEIQTRTADILVKLSEQMAIRNEVQSKHQADLHELIIQLAFRPCLMSEDQIKGVLEKMKTPTAMADDKA